MHYERQGALQRIKGLVDVNISDVENGKVGEGIYVSSFVIDPEARLVEIGWKNTRGTGASLKKGWLAIAEEGGMEGVIVKEAGQRVMTMERQIKGNWLRGGCGTIEWIEGLYGRLKWTA